MSHDKCLKCGEPVPASLVVLERKDVAMVKSALDAVKATDDHADPEVRDIVRIAWKLLESALEGRVLK